MQPFLIVLLVLVGFLLIAWLGLKVPPKPFPSRAVGSAEITRIPLPSCLPVPVERYYRVVYGEEIPVIESVIILGRGSIRPNINGPSLPVRFVWVHNPGRDYRHYFEATWFGIPFLRVNEGYVDGVSFFESPMGTYHDDPNTNQGANLALWAEAGWFPSLWLTDPRARWQPIDEHSALLYVPFENQEENFVVRFNPQTGLIDMMESMRYRSPGDKSKIPWINLDQPGAKVPGTRLSSRGAVMWLDHGKPWATFSFETVTYNADVSDYIRQRGV